MRLSVAALLAFGLTACEPYTRPNRPIPADFVAETLAGKRIDRVSMKGEPWVIALWVPG